ncbi:MAG: anaerobic ribonucleoside-triphosphate reductase activating protein [Ruminococcaceae bacterium]|nr:anaerobic ribonucleoside-triphosphate reductase activating protein [Oscillospiraceae bacterium]
MIIDGFQKLTLLDFPDKMACTVFTHGCNLRCPFCHNASLVEGGANEHIPEEEILAFLDKRKGLLDGVAITGGEPLLQKDIEEFIKKVREKGFLVKLDSNGCYPERLAGIIDAGLVDYVAMDVKSSPEKYALTVGVPDFDITPVKQSVEILKRGKVAYEFRTTVVKPLHENSDFESIGRWLEGAPRYFLQQFVDSGDVLRDGMSAYSAEEMEVFLGTVKNYIPSAELRGV